VPLFINQTTQQAATYDPTIFASSSDALADMTSTISSLTPGRFNGSDKDHPLWVRGFGMASSYEGTDATLDRSYNYSGVAIGYDFQRSKDLSLGVLGGYGHASLWANAESTQSFNTSSDDGFLGLYGQKRWKKVAVDFALYGGVQSFQQRRYVNDNLAYLGNSSANASYQGWWIAPEAALTYNAGEVNGWSLLPTARLRYAQQWMSGYTETSGGSANATVNGRNVGIGQIFVGIGTRKTMKTQIGKDTKMVIDGQVGYVYRGVVGDDTVGVAMIGQSQSLATESSSRNAVAVSAGVTLDLSSAVALKIRGDFAAGGGMQYGSGGWAGLSVKF
jgi:outer membrane autotransporter protein